MNDVTRFCERLFKKLPSLNPVLGNNKIPVSDLISKEEQGMFLTSARQKRMNINKQLFIFSKIIVPILVVSAVYRSLDTNSFAIKIFFVGVLEATHGL